MARAAKAHTQAWVSELGETAAELMRIARIYRVNTNPERANKSVFRLRMSRRERGRRRRLLARGWGCVETTSRLFKIDLYETAKYLYDYAAINAAELSAEIARP